jgi:hypothetical protein
VQVRKINLAIVQVKKINLAIVQVKKIQPSHCAGEKNST